MLALGSPSLTGDHGRHERILANTLLPRLGSVARGSSEEHVAATNPMPLLGFGMKSPYLAKLRRGLTFRGNGRSNQR